MSEHLPAQRLNRIDGQGNTVGKHDYDAIITEVTRAAPEFVINIPT
jgi:hypothetical protein